MPHAPLIRTLSWSGASCSKAGPPWFSSIVPPSPSSRRKGRLPKMFEARFQSFEARSERAASAPRLAALSAELKRRGLNGFIVPRADRYQNEYVPPCAERLAWLTGFTGSAGPRLRVSHRAGRFLDPPI